ncbi:MAG: hypothetical protein DRP87_02015 [Spirochaetes bacterium]|nr:MAG: hypothetical protein DRP87_02015 [Spirochaetota bacterium]
MSLQKLFVPRESKIILLSLGISTICIFLLTYWSHTDIKKLDSKSYEIGIKRYREELLVSELENAFFEMENAFKDFLFTGEDVYLQKLDEEKRKFKDIHRSIESGFPDDALLMNKLTECNSVEQKWYKNTALPQIQASRRLTGTNMDIRDFRKIFVFAKNIEGRDIINSFDSKIGEIEKTRRTKRERCQANRNNEPENNDQVMGFRFFVDPDYLASGNNCLLRNEGVGGNERKTGFR